MKQSLKTKLKRGLAFVVNLCMINSMFSGLVTAFAADSSVSRDAMHVIIRNWHTEDITTEFNAYVSFDGSTYSMTLEDSEYEADTNYQFDSSTGTITLAASPYEHEILSGYAISAGQDAINYVDNSLKVEYNEYVHLAKAHLFYNEVSTEVDGYYFGGMSSLIDDDIKFEDGTKFYSTAEGLHTDKTASVFNEDDRIYNINLESWYAGNNSADVGLILDASGSMSFISDVDDYNNMKPININDLGGTVDDNGNISLNINGKTMTFNTYEYITQDDLDNILNPKFTDSSKLGYSDYTYYVFDAKTSNNEFVPIGYWNGEGAIDTREEMTVTEYPISDGLLGYYKFDGGSGVNSAQEIIGSEATQGHQIPQPTSVNESFNYSPEGFSGGGTANGIDYNKNSVDKTDQKSLELTKMATNIKNKGKGAALVLEPEITSNSFTISFALRSDWKAKSGSDNTIVNLFTIGGTDGYVASLDMYNAGRLKFGDFKVSRGYTQKPGATNLKSAVAEKSGDDRDSKWHVYTYVVNEEDIEGETKSVVTVYVDGKKIEKDGNRLTSSTSYVLNNGIGDGKVVIGGYWDPAYQNNHMKLYMDEIFVYNRALSQKEVTALYNESAVTETKIYGTGIFGAKDQDGSIQGQVGSDDTLKVEDPNKVRGWYYMSPISNWANNVSNEMIATGKYFRPLLNNEITLNQIDYDKLPSAVKNYLISKTTSEEEARAIVANGNSDGYIINTNDFTVDSELKNSDQFYYYANGESVTLENAFDNDLVNAKPAIKLPSNANRQSASEENPTGAIIFYVDSEGFLRCVYNNGGRTSAKTDDVVTGVSYVYEKSDSQRIKFEDLQYAIGKFISKYHDKDDSSRISAVRFSTDRVITDYENNEHLEELVLLDWTKNNMDATKILSLKYGENADALSYEMSAPSADNFTTNNEGLKQYNYDMTGGTYAYTGLMAYKEYLDNLTKDSRINRDDNYEGPDPKKYLVIFTDGKDQSITDGDESNDNLAKDLATEFKNNGYTIYCVLLTGGAFNVTSDTETFISGLAGTATTNEEYEEWLHDNSYTAEEHSLYEFMNSKYIFTASNSTTLTETFTNEILADISSSLEDYDVQDYVDPRFNLVDKSGNVIILNKDGQISVNGETKTIDKNTGYSVNLENSKAMLYFDTEANMYFLKWTDQYIPACNVGEDKLTVWSKTFRVKAKDDFIGGNAVLTNGNESAQNMVYSKDAPESRVDSGKRFATPTEDSSYVSKGFPRTTVNVKILDLDISGNSKTIYLGEEISPNELFDYVSSTINNSLYWEYLSRYYNNDDTAIKNALTTLMSTGSLTLDYKYISDIGTDLHENDIFGSITYTWTVDPEAEKVNGYVTTNADTKTYNMSVTYNVDSVVARRLNLITDKDYDWDNDFKPAAGTENITVSDNDDYRVDIVKGQILVGVEITKEQYDYLYNNFKNQTISYSADLVSDTTVGTYSIDITFDKPWDELVASNRLTKNSNILTVYGDINWNNDNDYLPIGTYEVKANSIQNTLPIEFGILEVVDLNSNYAIFDADVNTYKAPIKDGKIYLGTDKSDNYLNDRLGLAIVDLTINKGNLSISKTVDDTVDNVDNGKSFEFTLTLDSAGTYNYIISDNNGEVSNGTIKNGESFNLKNGQTILIKDIPANTNYSIVEKDSAGYTQKVDKSSGIIEANSTSEANFINTYAATGEIELVVGKTLKGRNWYNDSFEIDIEANNTDGISGLKDKVILTDTNRKANIFDGVTFSKTGTYNFKVSEKSVEDDKLIYDNKSYDIEVNVTDNGDGTLSATTSYVANDGIHITFENQAIVTWTPKVKKNIVGRDWNEDTFEFNITQVSGTSVKLPNAITVNNNEITNFDSIVFKEAGKYVFNIKETDAGNKINGLTYDNDYVNGHIIEVDVVDSNGELIINRVIIDSVSTDILVVNNIYSATAKWNPQVSKELVGREWNTSDNYSFTISTDSKDVEMPENKTVSVNMNNKIATFDDIIFNNAGEYNFIISENHGSIPGITYDTNIYNIKVSVKDNLDGTLTISGVSEKPYKFINSYSAKSTTATINIAKEFIGREWKVSDIFTANFKQISGNSVQTPETITLSKEAKPVTITFDRAGTYVFELSEVNNAISGVSYDNNTYTIEIIVNDNQNGQLEIASINKNNITFRNEYLTKPVNWTIDVEKVLNGRTWTNNDKFKFKLNKISGEAAENSNQTITIDNSNHTKAFENVVFSKPGTYVFEISEEGSDSNGITYDKTVYNVVVIVSDDTNGNLITSTTINNKSVDKVTFTNTYSVNPVTWTPSVEKILIGRNWTTNDKFTINMSGVDINESVTITSKSLKNNKYIESFKPITFTKAGVYEFNFTEAYGGETINGVTYDNKNYSVTVNIIDNGDGTLTATPSIENIVFTNEYKANSASWTPSVEKILNGRDWADFDKYTFVLESDLVNDSVTITKDSLVNGKYIEAFKEIVFNKAGQYNFTIKEVNGDIGGVIYDSTIYNIIVNVIDNGDGTLSVEGTSPTYVFTNTYSAKPTTTNVNLSKILLNRDWKNSDSFTFNIEQIDGPTINIPDFITVTNDSTQTINLVFDNIGKYTFKISESKEDISGIIYDNNIYTISINVIDNGVGNLVIDSAKVDNIEVNSIDIKFTNVYYTKAATWNASVQKNILGRDWLDTDKFEISLELIEGELENVSNADQIITVSNNDIYTFDDVVFSKPGEYKFEIKELGSNHDGLTYDTNTYEVTLVVTDDTNGNLVIDKEPQLFTFNNSYYASPVDVNLQINKELKNREWTASDKFEFNIEQIEGPEVILPNIVINGVDNYTGTISDIFSITFDEVGTYKFAISEVSNNVNGITCDSTEYEVTIVISDNNIGQLVAEVSTSDIDFINIYKPESVVVDIEIAKELIGRNWNNDTFKFNIEQLDGTSVNLPDISITGVNGNDIISQIASIEFVEAGTYKFRVTEVNTNTENITYDTNTYDIIVVVTDNHLGNLVADITINNEETNKIKFTNIYTEPIVPPVKDETPNTGDETPNTGDETPNTGDETNMTMALILLAASIVIVIRKCKN